MLWLDLYYCIEPVSDYLSDPSLCMEYRNWSNIMGSYSDKVVGNLLAQVILKESTPLVGAGLVGTCYFIEPVSE